MRKSTLIVMLVIIVGLLVAGGTFYQKYQKSKADYVALQADEQATRERYTQAVGEIAAIEDSLNAIVLGDQGAQQLATQLEQERSLSKDRGDEVIARIAQIRGGLQRAKARIQDLETKVQESGVKMAGLEKMIQNLRVSVTEKEAMIAQLTQRVEELQTQVTGLQAEVKHGQETIQAQTETIEAQTVAMESTRRELGTIYYTIGTKNELKDAGLIEAKGGFLGIGRTLKPTGVIDETRFTPLDTDREAVIRIPADKAKILTPQPPLSFELQIVGSDQMELHILDAKAFRTVKHVIIMTG